MKNQGRIVSSPTWCALALLTIVLLTGCGGGGGSGGGGPVPPDTAAPSVVSSTPAAGAIDVAVDASLKVTFTEPVDPATVNGTTLKVRGGDKEMAGSISCDHDTITFTPATNWGIATTYTVTVSGGPSGVKDLWGISLATDHTWTFSTGQAPDTNPPTVTGQNPNNDAIGVSVYTTATVTFSEVVINVTTATFRLTQGDAPISGTVSLNGSTATFLPSAPLSYGKSYTATVTSEVKDISGDSLAADHSWVFTTGDQGWGTPTLIESASGNALFPHVAMDTNGTSIIVWYRDDGPVDHVYVNQYVPGTGWRVPILMETGSGEDRNPQVAMDDSGNAIAVWEHGDYGTGLRIYASQYTPGAGWGAPAPIETGPGDAYGPQVAMDSGGNAIAVWRKVDGNRWCIFTNHFTPGTGWGTATIIDAGVGNANSPQVTIDRSGNATVVWLEGCELDGTLCSVYANRYIQGAGWETPTLIETGPANAYGPQVAMDGSGNAIAVWYQGFGVGGYSVWANRFATGTGWEMPTLIGSSVWASLAPPKLAMDRNGNAIAVWWYWGAKEIYANWYVAGTGWETPTIIHTGTGYAGFSEVAMDGNGNAIVVWTQSDGSVHNVYAKRYVPGKGWANSTIIDTGTKWAEGPEVAMDSTGSAIAVWMGGDGTGHDIWANRYETP